MKDAEEKIERYLDSGQKMIIGWKVSSLFGDAAFYNGDWREGAIATSPGGLCPRYGHRQRRNAPAQSNPKAHPEMCENGKEARADFSVPLGKDGFSGGVFGARGSRRMLAIATSGK